MLEFIDYISWVYGDQQPENSYQFVRKQKSKDIEQYPESIIYGFEFWEFYYSCLFTISPFSNAPNFLEYHYDKYEGNKSDFLTFVKWSLSIMEPLKHLDFIAAINANSRTPFIKDLIFEWIEKKKKLETDPVHSSIKKIPRLNKYNKPLLNQVQISILFRVMKDMNIISNRDLPKNSYSEIIHFLTGYSANKIRANLSAPELIEISDRPQDYQEIIANLQVIIDRLVLEKNKISTGD